MEGDILVDGSRTRDCGDGHPIPRVDVGGGRGQDPGGAMLEVGGGGLLVDWVGAW